MNLLQSIGVVLVCSISIHYSDAAGCSISVKDDVKEPQPLIVKPLGVGNEAIDVFYLPDENGNLQIGAKEVVTVECPGGYLEIRNVSSKIKSENITCVNGARFDFDEEIVDFNEITCTRNTKHIARYNGKSCLKTYKEIEIGFELETGKFLNHITVCFDDEFQNSLYTVYSLTSTIAQYQVAYPRVEFIDGGFYSLGDEKISNIYARNTQREYLNAQLGLEASSTKYVHASNDYYLARGHLTAKTDFIFGSQQRLTFYYVNAAPQWQTHNAGNWLSLEDSVRRLSSERSLDLVVYTGTHGITTLPDEETGEPVELYLYVDEEGYVAVPVPQLFWKVVYEPNSKLAVAMIGINNPYHEDVEDEIICKDICDQVEWIDWKQTDVKAGYSYCCTVPSFRKVVKTLPAFKVSGVLT